MILSERAKDAIKTALAMTMAYGIALALEWEKPYWASYAVAFISSATIEESLQNGMWRMLGVFVACTAALTIIAMFPQQRWGFIVMLMIYVGICTWLMAGSKLAYFYQVSAFVCVIICFAGGVNSLHAFETAMARIEEAGMGIIVYTLVATFFGPGTTSAKKIAQQTLLDRNPQRYCFSIRTDSHLQLRLC